MLMVVHAQIRAGYCLEVKTGINQVSIGSWEVGCLGFQKNL